MRLAAFCSAEGGEAASIPTSVDDESLLNTGRIIPAALFTHGPPQGD
jgi:hypothetical protein